MFSKRSRSSTSPSCSWSPRADHHRMRHIGPQRAIAHAHVARPATVLPTAAVHGDAVVGGTQEAVGDAHVRAGHHVDAVGPSLAAERFDAADRHIARRAHEHRVVRRIDEDKVLKRHVLGEGDDDAARTGEPLEIGEVEHSPAPHAHVLGVVDDQRSLEHRATLDDHIGVRGDVPHAVGEVVVAGLDEHDGAGAPGIQRGLDTLVDLIAPERGRAGEGAGHGHVGGFGAGFRIGRAAQRTGEDVQVVLAFAVDLHAQVRRLVEREHQTVRLRQARFDAERQGADVRAVHGVPALDAHLDLDASVEVEVAHRRFAHVMHVDLHAVDRDLPPAGIGDGAITGINARAVPGIPKRADAHRVLVAEHRALGGRVHADRRIRPVQRLTRFTHQITPFTQSRRRATPPQHAGRGNNAPRPANLFIFKPATQRTGHALHHFRLPTVTPDFQ